MTVVWICSEVFEAEFKDKFEALGIDYEHRLIDDMVAAALKWNGKFVWACKNYDGDVQSDTAAQGFAFSLMTSVLLTPDGKTIAEAAWHGDAPLSRPSARRRNLTNSIASIFAWTRGLAKRAEWPRMKHWPFSLTLEKTCVKTVERGSMTKDLALLVGEGQEWLSTEGFLDKLNEILEKALSA